MNKNTIKKLKSFLTKSSKKSVFYVHEPHLEKKDHKFLQKCVEKNEVSSSGFYEKKLEKKLKDLTNAKYLFLYFVSTSDSPRCFSGRGFKDLVNKLNSLT